MVGPSSLPVPTKKPDQPNHLPDSTPPRLLHADAARALSLYQGNCLDLLDSIAAEHPEGRFDCIFADPPYFLSNGGITCQAGKMVKVLKPNGTLWVTGTHHAIFSIGFAMQQLGFKILNDIAWEKPNPPPNLSCRYFTHSTETVLWAANNERSKHVFNYQAMRAANGGKQMKTVWKMTAPGKAEKGLGKHPTQKPLALIERCLLAATNEGDLVLDPFLGAGSTVIAALHTKRGCVGIELDEVHAKLSVKRLRKELDRLDSELFPALA